MAEESQISRYYANKKILITGGTGFMGKVLIWKLLQSCPQLDTVFLLLRTKHGKNAVSRKEEIFNSPIFETLKRDNPEVLEKVIFISGDVGEEGIALSDVERNMLIEQVSVVFHSAAILKMNANLRTAVNINTQGTKRMLDLAREMNRLEAFVYVSTAFCCCDNSTVEERIYPSKHHPYDIINLVRWMEPELLEKVTPSLIHPLPNTYVYSKRLTESLLTDYTSKVPLIVARPTIVTPSYEEPIPGWNDQIYGPAGLFIAGGKGVLRVTMMNGNTAANFIYVDTAINAILTLPWANSKNALLKEIAVYNISQSAFDDLTWQEITELVMRSYTKRPFEMILWYPSGNLFTDNVLVYNLKCIFFHYLPAYVIDSILMLIGKKCFLVRVHDKLKQGERVLRYFTQNNWEFSNEKLFKIGEQLNDSDRRIFPITMDSTDFEEYTDNIVAAARRYLFNEDETTIEASKIRLNIMYVVDKIFLALRYYLLWKIFTFVFDLFLQTTELYSY